MKFPVFDGHCDTPMELWLQAQPLARNRLAVSLARAAQLGGWAQFFSFCTAWVANRLPHPEQYAQALSNFQVELERNQDRITLCRTADEAHSALQQNKAAAFLSIEGAEALRCDPGRLDEAYAQGVRMISLVWNLPNALGGSCKTGEGLTPQGKEFFRRAQRLGMLVDVSHLSDRGFWDMTELAERPIVASHSNARAVCAHARNLTDEQFLAICQLGGTAGINLCAPFLSEAPRATFDDVRRHLDHFLALGGAQHVAFGADLDGTDLLPEGFSTIADYDALGAYLARGGYTEETLRAIFGNSLMKVVKQCIM